MTYSLSMGVAEPFPMGRTPADMQDEFEKEPLPLKFTI
jgi:hypothetical protein